MLEVNPDSQVDAFRIVLELENRGQQLDSLIARTKQLLVTDLKNVPLPEVVGLLDELRWQITHMQNQVGKFEEFIGIQRRPVTNTPARKASPNNSLRGTTDAMPIPDVIGLLSAQKKTGTLRIKGRDERFILEFLDGAVVHAMCDKPHEDQRLGNILVAKRKISTEKLDEFLNVHQGGKIGPSMTKAELISEDDLRECLEHQVRHLFQRIFALDQAIFAFADGSVSDVELRVSLNATQLLLDTARRQDEDDRMDVEFTNQFGDEDDETAESTNDTEASEESSTEADQALSALDVIVGTTDGDATSEAEPAAEFSDEECPEAECQDTPTDEPAAEARHEDSGLGSTTEADSNELPSDSPFAGIPGLRKAVAQGLILRDITDIDALRAASDEELREVPGLGDKTLQTIRTFLS